jgi:hypothetical protein
VKQGAQGQTGAQGTQGLTGAKGGAGEKGDVGAQGLTGIQGAQGQTGAQGTQGLTGAKGGAGEKGTTGVDGAAIQGNIDNNIMTSIGSTGIISGSTKYTFDGDTVHLEGNIQIDQQTLTDAAPVIWDMTNGSNAKFTFVSNSRTLSITNAVTGDTGVILVKQGTGTTYNLTLPATSVIIGGGTYTTTTTSNGIDVLGVYYDGSNYYWSIPNGTTGEKGAQGITGTKQGITGTKKGAQGATGPTGGSDTQVLYNDGGTSAGSADMTFANGDKILTVERLNVGLSAGTNDTDGLIRAENDVIAYATSDRRLKENILPILNALDKVKQIQGVTFDWIPLTKEQRKILHGNEGHDIGVIAQEIEAVLPELVTTRDNGYKAVKYEKIVALLIEAIKEQQGEIDELKRKINE